MEIRAAVAKVAKFGYGESGDTTDIAERPRGGLTVALADGQGHGRAAKRTSQLVINRALALIGDGARDGATARAVHDYLYAVRDGKVSCELVLVSVDLHTQSLVISRNTAVPVLVFLPDRTVRLEDEVPPIGVHQMMKPSVYEHTLTPPLLVAAFTDGVLRAGRGTADAFRLERVEELGQTFLARPGYELQALADAILKLAMEADSMRPRDDMSVLVVAVVPSGENGIRRMTVSVPVG